LPQPARYDVFFLALLHRKSRLRHRLFDVSA
jgi:hypothetical protein